MVSIHDGLLFEDDGAETVVQDSRARAIRRKRNVFRTHAAPTALAFKTPVAWQLRSDLVQTAPPDLERFVDWFENEPDSRERFRWALRDSLDEVLDGQRTGRWCYQHLTKTEKTYLGTAVEVNLTKEFEIENGSHLDWSLAGADIDCKFSKDLGGWEIPMEMYLCEDHGDRQGKANHPALLTWMNDDTSQWAAGVVTVTDERLRWKVEKFDGPRVRAYNRDNKRKLADIAKADVYWLWGGIQSDLPRNLLLHLHAEVRSRILTGTSGQKRVDHLFRETQDRIIGRQTVLTVAQQDDAPKRARDARIHLRQDGILVLGHQESHPEVARRLQLPVPVKGEWIATRVVPIDETERRPSFSLGEQRWARALPSDPVSAAPELPRKQLGPQVDVTWGSEMLEYKALNEDRGHDPSGTFDEQQS